MAEPSKAAKKAAAPKAKAAAPAKAPAVKVAVVAAPPPYQQVTRLQAWPELEKPAKEPAKPEPED